MCGAVGMARSNYYKVRRSRSRREVDEGLVLELVARQRAFHPRRGARKLLLWMRSDLADAGISMGRDRFFDLLARHDRLILRKARSVRTTWSGHGLRWWPNAAAGLVLSGPNQLWVSDITYLRLVDRFMYLALVMDAWSRAIVGYDCSGDLEMSGALRALEMGLRDKPSGARPMHHSDRGCQYCAGAYIGLLESSGMGISMTERNHCYENAMAERLNRTMKEEYGLGGTLIDPEMTRALVRQGVWLYNEDRPHTAIGNRVPMRLHRGEVELKGGSEVARARPAAPAAELLDLSHWASSGDGLGPG